MRLKRAFIVLLNAAVPVTAVCALTVIALTHPDRPVEATITNEVAPGGEASSWESEGSGPTRWSGGVGSVGDGFEQQNRRPR